jgi:hypothetical protein
MFILQIQGVLSFVSRQSLTFNQAEAEAETDQQKASPSRNRSGTIKTLLLQSPRRERLMSEQDLLDDLLLRWEEQLERGREPPAVELCAACPHLLGRLETEIAKLKESPQ